MMKQLVTALALCLAAFSTGGIEWKRGAIYGADVRSLVIAPSDPDLVFLGTSRGEVYVSRDGGLSWTSPRQSVPFPGYVIDNIAIDVNGHLWVAGWGLWEGGLVAVSRDGGRSWERRDSGIEQLSIRAFSLVAGDANILIAGGLSGVYRSRDAGKSWEQISSQPNVESLAVDPRSADRIYIGTWRQMWRTDDGGESWRHIAKGMVLDTDVFGISIDSGNPDDVWLSTCGWVYHSKNRGESWNRYRDGFQNRRVHVVARDITDPETIWAGSVGGLYRTGDLGKTWELISDEQLVINAIAVHPKRPDRMILGTEGDGVYVSEDGGGKFQRSSRGLLSVKVSDIASDPGIKGRLVAAVMFGGMSSGVYESLDHGESWTRSNETGMPEILAIEFHQGPRETFLIAGTELGIFINREGAGWTRAEPTTIPMRVEQILPYNRSRLFAATSEGVFTSNDAGASWHRLTGSWVHARDLAIGEWRSKTALFALHADGLSVFTEDGWEDVTGAPGGNRILVRNTVQGQVVLVGDSRRWEAAVVSNGRWKPIPAEIPDGTVIANDSGSWLMFRSRRDRHLLFGDELGGSMNPTGLSLDAREISDAIIDPFDSSLVYVATSGSGIYIMSRESIDEAQLGGSK